MGLEAEDGAMTCDEPPDRICAMRTPFAWIALLIALVSAFADYRGDKEWQDQQTKLLTEIRDRLPATTPG